VRPPTLVAHADWGWSPPKRWLARACLEAGRYVARAPEPVGAPPTLLGDLVAAAPGGGPVLLGFDFPIGLPAAYAERVGITRFLDVLPGFGEAAWPEFYRVADRPEDIALARPFYPDRPGLSGARRRVHLAQGLGVTLSALWRACDRKQPYRRAAAPIFWTLGGQQVGKAAISGWRDVLGPALRSGDVDVAIWPFAGRLGELLRPGRVVIVECYPAEIYAQLGLVFRRRGERKWGKRIQADRRANAARLFAWARSAGVALAPSLRKAIASGFGAGADGEDRFDAVVGLCGMLETALGRRPPGEPDDEVVRAVEGWILGLRV